MESNQDIEQTAWSLPTQLDAEIFRSYDIRGIVDEQLTPQLAYAVGLALGTQLMRLDKPAAAIGRDARPSSRGLQSALMQGLRETGCDAIDIGLVPTPVLYFATVHCKSLCYGSGFMITGSHNPSHYNGIKMVLAGETLHSDAVTGLYRQIVQQDLIRLPQSQWGQLLEKPVVAEYLEDVCGRIRLTRPLRIVIDAGNGMAGEIAPVLFKRLGCEVEALYCELDGNFPNHHPDPTVPENLKDLIDTVQSTGADCGLAFDGDADRLGIVTPKGDIIWPDLQMMFYARDLLSRQPGATVVYDVKCSGHLADVIDEAGGVPLMWKTGHSLLKAKMFAADAGMAGEMSGHIFFRENWYGFDDGIYAGARFLQYIAAQSESCQELYDALPKGEVTPELKIYVAEKDKMSIMEKIIQQAGQLAVREADAKICLIDGVRIDYSDGFGLLRASNTTPCIIARFEGDNKQIMLEIAAHFKKILLAIDASLKVPF